MKQSLVSWDHIDFAPAFSKTGVLTSTLYDFATECMDILQLFRDLIQLYGELRQI